MAESTTQKFIDTLITFIWNAEDQESITNAMVAQVFDFLNKGFKDLQTKSIAIDTEISECQAADIALQKTISALELTVQEISKTAKDAEIAADTNRQSIDLILGNNASQAIENLQEIIIFLEGLKDDERLAELLMNMSSRIDNISDKVTEHLTGHRDGTFGDIETFFQDAENVVTDVQLKRKDDGSLDIDIYKGSVGSRLSDPALDESIALPEATLHESGLMSKEDKRELRDVRSGISHLNTKVDNIPLYRLDSLDCSVLDRAHKDNSLRPSVQEMEDDGWRIIFDRRMDDENRRFVAFREDADGPGTYTDHFEGEEKYNSDGIARKDVFFLYGGNIYHVDYNCELVRMVDETEMRESIMAQDAEMQERFVGVWDELEEIRAFMAATATDEVQSLLAELGYEQADIDEYITANINVGAGITLDELRDSVERWRVRDTLQKPITMPVVPKFKTTWIGDADTPAKFLDCLDSCKYLPVLDPKSYDPGEHWFNDKSLLAEVRYIGGIEQTGGTALELDLSGLPELRGVGRIVGNIKAVTFSDDTKLKYVKNIVSGTQRFYNGVYYAMFNEVQNLRDITGVQISDLSNMKDFLGGKPETQGKRTPVSLPVCINEFSPPRITGIDWENAFVNRYLEGETLNIPYNNRNVFSCCNLKDCDISILMDDRNFSPFLLTYSVGGSTKVRVKEFKLPTSTLFSYSAYSPHGAESIGEWDAVLEGCNYIVEAFTKTRDSRARIFPFEAGYVQSLNRIPLKTLLPYTDNPDLPNEKFYQAIQSWADRVTLGYETVEVTMESTLYDKLPEDFITEYFTNKGYTLIIV